jgi:hypothetical protein
MKHSVVQTRSDEYGMSQFNTISEAFAYAQKDRSVWKISFSVGSNKDQVRYRFVRHTTDDNLWENRPLIWGQEDDDLAPIDKRVADLLPSYFRYLPEN